jgi:hypothetical protein
MDIVEYALNDAAEIRKTKDELRWKVSFTDGEHRQGKINQLGPNAYRIDGNASYYFTAEQVVRLMALSDQ